MERRIRRIPIGLYRGLKMELYLTSELQLYLGLPELETHEWIRRWSREAVSAVDVGAGNGELVLYWSSCPNIRKVYAFEPSEKGRGRIARNLQNNGNAEDGRVTVSRCFVGSKNDSGYRALDSLGLTEQLPCLIKIDVDGAERDILEGARNLLASRKVFWVVRRTPGT